MARKLSKSHQADVDVKNQAQREVLAFHHVLRAITADSQRKWGTLEKVGSAYDSGDSWVWQSSYLLPKNLTAKSVPPEYISRVWSWSAIVQLIREGREGARGDYSTGVRI